MDLLADLIDLQYFMMDEISSDKHLILVKNTKNGTGGYFILETGEVQDSDLDNKTLQKVKAELRSFRWRFLDYWQKLKRERR